MTKKSMSNVELYLKWVEEGKTEEEIWNILIKIYNDRPVDYTRKMLTRLKYRAKNFKKKD